MSKKIVAVSASMRAGSNSGKLLDAFIAGAEAAGHEVEKISLRGMDLRYCQGCLACSRTGRCVIRDDAQAVVDKISQADVVVFATPIYSYDMCGQLKTLLDRSNPMYYAGHYRFRDVYLLTAAAWRDEEVTKRAAITLGGWLACLPKARLVGTVFAGGVEGPGAVEGHPALAEARRMGESV